MAKQKPTLNQADVALLMDEFDKRLDWKLEQKLEEKLEQKLEQKLEEKLEEKLGRFPTKEEFYKRMDELMKELQDSRDDRVILSGRVSDHEERIEKLEEAVGMAV